MNERKRDERINENESKREREVWIGKRARKEKTRLENQYALCFGVQLKGRESLLSIFFDQQLLESFSHPPPPPPPPHLLPDIQPGYNRIGLATTTIVLQDSSAWRALQKRTNAATICTYGSFHAFIKNWTPLSKAPSSLFFSFFPPLSSSFHPCIRLFLFNSYRAVFVQRSPLFFHIGPGQAPALFFHPILFLPLLVARVDRQDIARCQSYSWLAFHLCSFAGARPVFRWKLFPPVFRAGHFGLFSWNSDSRIAAMNREKPRTPDRTFLPWITFVSRVKSFADDRDVRPPPFLFSPRLRRFLPLICREIIVSLRFLDRSSLTLSPTKFKASSLHRRNCNEERINKIVIVANGRLRSFVWNVLVAEERLVALTLAANEVE